MFNPASMQPLQPFFEINMGSLRQIYEDPNFPVSMDLTLSLEGKVSNLVLSFFDEYGWDIESAVWESADPVTGLPGGTFKFGYKGDAKVESEEFPFQVARVIPRYENNAFTVTLLCDLALDPLMTSSKYSGTLEECIDKFCELYNFEKNIDPPFGTEHMQSLGDTDRNTTESREMLHRKLAHENDWRFMQRITMYAADQEGKFGYKLYVTGKGGKRILNVVKLRSASADYTYIVQDKEGVVVSWAPEINYAAVYGGYDTHHNTTEKLTGNTLKTTLNEAVTKDLQSNFGYDVYEIVNSAAFKGPPETLHHKCAESMQDNVVNGAIRQRTGGSATTLGGMNPILANHIIRQAGNNRATLEIAGDPQIVPDKIADIQFYYPLNFKNNRFRQMHYSSGLYHIVEVHHHVGIEGFTTSLTMERAGIPVEPQTQEAPSD